MNARYILIISLLCPPLFSNAQQALSINGVLFKKSTSERVSQATVTDMQSQVIMMSDELGGFTIKAVKGDTLIFNKKGYTEQKEVVAGPGDVAVYMQPIVVLQQVTIKGESTRQELNDVKDVYRSKGLYFDGKPPWTAFITSPFTAVYELFSADAKHERHFAQFSKNELEAVEIDKRYTKELVKRITHLPDDDVIKFMQQYRPSYEDMRAWNDYDLVSHIKKYLVYYNKHKEGISVQKLY